MKTNTNKKTNTFLSRFKQSGHRLHLRFSDFLLENGKGFCILVQFLYPLLFGAAAMDTGLPRILSFLLMSGISFLLLWLFRFLLLALCRFFAAPFLKGRALSPEEKRRIQLDICILFSYGINLSYFCYSSYRTGVFYSVLLTLLFSTALLFSALSGYSLFVSRPMKKKRSWVLFSSSGLVLFAFLFFFCTRGWPDSFVKDAKSMQETVRQTLTREEELSFRKNYLEPGAYTPESILYGKAPGTSVFSNGNTDETILPSSYADLSSFFPSDASFLSLHDWYITEDRSHVKLSGKIWYPKECSSCPVLFFIHGNHTMTEPSYLGYDYLGRYLASHGYVVVSVDENFCNFYIAPTISGEDDARAILLLENIRQVLAYNIEESNPVYGKIDASRIAIGGHSRGGESVADAAFLNQCTAVPDNGARKLSYHFNIQAVIAVAPTSECYRPAGHELSLTDISYLLIHGSNDQDVSTMMGISQYQDVTFSGKKDAMKAFVYIIGANHGQFNSIWGQTDTFFPLSRLHNTGNFIPEDEQQKLLQVYVKEFLDATFHKEGDASRDFFQRNAAYQPLLSDTIFFTGYEDSSFLPVCTFEEDADITRGTMEGTWLSASHTAYYEMEQTVGSEKSGHGVCLSFSGNEPAAYQIQLDGIHARNHSSCLTFDLMNLGQPGFEDAPLSLSVTLTDKKGREYSLPASSYAPLYPSLPVTLFKLECFLKNPVRKSCFQTIRIPLADFGIPGLENEALLLSPDSIRKITFSFQSPAGGKVMLDNIGFSE